MLVVWQGLGRVSLKEWVGWTCIIRKGRSTNWHASQCNAAVGHNTSKPVHVLAVLPIISYRQFQRERDSISVVGIHAFLLTRDSLHIDELISFFNLRWRQPPHMLHASYICRGSSSPLVTSYTVLRSNSFAAAKWSLFCCWW
jgi:hypothetical protein